jgi:hypothetical protein
MITAIILLTYCSVITGFVTSYLAAIEEKEKQNLLTGLLLVGVLVGSFVFIYLKHVFISRDGKTSRYKRHPPVFSSSSDKIRK